MSLDNTVVLESLWVLGLVDMMGRMVVNWVDNLLVSKEDLMVVNWDMMGRMVVCSRVSMAVSIAVMGNKMMKVELMGRLTQWMEMVITLVKCRMVCLFQRMMVVKMVRLKISLLVLRDSLNLGRLRYSLAVLGQMNCL